MSPRFLDQLRYDRIIAEFQAANTDDIMFFERIGLSSGLGNSANFISRPYDLFHDYQLFLKDCQNIDALKYEAFHKGTPFFFLAWLSLDLKDYEKALFYMDAAVSEDIRANRSGWHDLPAANFLQLGLNHAARRTTELIRNAISRELDRFNAVSGLTVIQVQDFVNRLYSRLGNDVEKRTIITAIYTFILEYEDRCLDLALRGSAGGSSEPFLVHLFKGGLIFESLLKELYPQVPANPRTNTLGRVLRDRQFMTDFSLTRVDTSASTLTDIYTSISADDLSSAFITSAKLRNTTGHNLCWDDVFNSPGVYQRFFEQEVNAILYLVALKL